jgi:hypothetical protein
MCPDCQYYYNTKITKRSYGGCELGFYPPHPSSVKVMVEDCRYFKVKKRTPIENPELLEDCRK